MKHSEFVENLGKQEIKVYDETGIRKLGQPDQEQTRKAFKKICELWNRNQGSRNFIVHLIDAFTPLQPLFQVAAFGEEDVKNGKNRCCILGIKCAGVGEITEALTKFGMTRLRMSCQVWSGEKVELGKDDIKALKELRQSYPIEVRTATTAYSSLTSDKIVSCHAAWALDYFRMEAILGNVPEINRMLYQKRIKASQERRKEWKEAHEQKPLKRTEYNMSDLLKPEDAEKLKGIK